MNVTSHMYQVPKKLQVTSNMELGTSLQHATCSLQLATERSLYGY